MAEVISAPDANVLGHLTDNEVEIATLESKMQQRRFVCFLVVFFWGGGTCLSIFNTESY